MNDTRPQLEMRWLPITDERGRTQMVATWFALDDVRAGSESAAA